MDSKLILASLFAISSLAAEECCPPQFDSCICDPGPKAARVTVRSRQPGGIGYSTGYSSIDLFYAPGTLGDFTSFFDLRAHVFNNGKPAFNAGLGLRYLPACTDIVYGINAYWDYRQTKHEHYNQVGLGLEALWTRWDLHLNGYAPIGQTKKSYRTGFLGFQGNHAFFYRKYELSMWGGDLALGYKFYTCNWFDLHATADAYYFQGDYGEHAAGGFLRLRSNVCDYITIEGQVSYDSLFKWNGQGELAFNIPFGKTVKRYPRQTTCCDDIIALEKRLVEKPDRFEIIPTTTHRKRGIALDPITGLPLTFLFVDNTSHSAGTFESPYPTLAQANAVSKAGDVIYIFPGDGTSRGLDTFTLLKDRQSLVGSGAPFEVTTRFGNLIIPAFTDSLPLINVSTSPFAVTPSSNNLISGLKIFGASAIGANELYPISNLSILNCILAGTNQTIAFLSNGGIQGQVTIAGNRLSSLSTSHSVVEINTTLAPILETDLFFRNNQIETGGNTGLFVRNVGDLPARTFVENNWFFNMGSHKFGSNLVSVGNGPKQYFVRNNTFSAPNSNSGGIFITGNPPDAILKIAIEHNRLSVSNDAIAIATNGIVTARVKDNEINLITPSGIGLNFQKMGGTFALESSNGALSGVENSNKSTGPAFTFGTLDFIPLQ